MRHKVAGFKLKRPKASRNALLRNLITSVIEQERIVTRWRLKGRGGLQAGPADGNDV